MPFITWIFERQGALAFIAIAVACLLIYRIRRIPSPLSKFPLPPGPKRLPVIGNTLDIPSVRPWLTFTQWAKTFGDVIYLHLPHQGMVVLGSVEAAIDLMEKRQIYADRPQAVMTELMGWDWNVGLMPYGPKWRNVRQPLHHYFHPSIVHEYHPLQTNEARALIRRLHASPDAIEQNVRRTIAGTILRIVYGTEVLGMYDEYISLAETAVTGISEAGIPGAFWVEFLPFLRYLPVWTPGAKFHRVAAYYKPFADKMRSRAFEVVKAAVAQGTASPSMACTMIQDLQKCDDADVLEKQEEIAINATGIAYAAAIDSTTATFMFFIMAMVMYPDVQRKAQAELDAHIGPGRLPEFDDLDSLNYIKAVALETMRWQPATPLGIPHLVNADDEYKGYHIPKGSVVMANIWAMMHDPEQYPEPDPFNPDRFIKDGKLNPDMRDPSTILFGFGRRICVGRHLSKDSLLITIATMLHVYNMEPERDENGNIVELKTETCTGLLSHPHHIPCVLKLRSATAERLIYESEET